MKVAILSNIFSEDERANLEVEEDLETVGKAVKEALASFGHEVKFYDVNEKVFEKLRRDKPDAAFNVCERFNGSNFFEPHVASMLELLGIPYTGSGPLTLATCINKPRVKAILMHQGLPTPKYQLFYSRWRKLNPELKFPLMVKPACLDNSIGIDNDSVAESEEQMRSQIYKIIKTYNQPALVEEYVEGREITVAVMGNDKEAIALPISEIIFKELPEDAKRIMGYDAKWCKESMIYKGTSIECPAQMPKYLEQKIKKAALDVHRILEARDYSRVDMRVDENNNPYILEMNPNPGISADCFLPKAAESIGYKYPQMINAIFCDALDRFGVKNDKRVTRIKLPEEDEKIEQQPIAVKTAAGQGVMAQTDIR